MKNREKRRENIRKFFLYVIVALFIGLFTHAAVAKLSEYGLYVHDMKKQPLPLWLTTRLPWIIPGIEILLVLMLFIQPIQRIGLIASTALMTLFSGYIALGLLNVFGDIPCGCGGVFSKLSWSEHLLLNLFYVGIGIVGVFLYRRTPRVDSAAVHFV